MIVTSLFSWSFLGASLALCSILLNQYQILPDFTIAEVFGGSLLASLVFSTVVTTFARRHAFTSMMQSMTLGPTSFTRLSGAASSFVGLCRRMGIYNVSLREATRGGAFSISLRGRGVVAIASEMAASLSAEETEAVLAHELSHIKNGDSAAKGIAKLARMALPFDPVLRLVEAAVHRERELWADCVSAEITRNPLALASALVKVNAASFRGSSAYATGFFVGGNGHGIFNPYPSLERRVDALLLLARRMEFVSIVLVNA